jgi:hypothetical protein
MQPDLEQPGTLARALRELPDEAAQPYGWSEFQRRAQQRTLDRRSRSGGQALAALAALAVLALGAVALSLRFSGAARQAPHLQDLPAARDAAETPAFGAAEPQWASAARADVLERWLASLPEEPALARVGTRAAVTGLEDRLAEVDDLLTAERIDQAQPAHLLALQQERRRLVSSLAQVRYAETLADESR